MAVITSVQGPPSGVLAEGLAPGGGVACGCGLGTSFFVLSVVPSSMIDTAWGAARVTVMGTSTELSAGSTPIWVLSAVNVYSGSVGRSRVMSCAAIRPWLVTVTLKVADWPGC